MGEQFYTILTSIGKAKIANSNVLGIKLNLTKFQVGDGGGSYYNPTEDQTQLKNKVWEGNINSIRVDANNPNWIVIEVVIPSNQGGFMVREAGVTDNEGNLIAIGKYPETFKPHIDNGSSKDLFIRMILEVSNTQNVTLKVDPTVIMATKKDIEILDNRLSKLEKEIYDNELEVLKTDVLITPLVGCSGGFVNVDNIQGRTLVNLFSEKATTVTRIEPEFAFSVDYSLNRVVGQNTYTFINFTNKKVTLPSYNGTTWDVSYECKENGITVINLPSGKELHRIDFYINQGWQKTDISNFSKINFMLLEGDWTNKPIPAYFDGIKSVGELTPIGNNLFEGVIKSGYSNILTISDNATVSQAFRTENFISIQPNKEYIVNWNNNTTATTNIHYSEFDSNKNLIVAEKFLGNKTGIIKTSSNGAYIRIHQFNSIAFNISTITSVEVKEIQYRIEILSKGNKNLFSKDGFQRKYINLNTGELLDDTVRVASDYLNVLPNKTYTISTNSPNYIIRNIQQYNIVKQNMVSLFSNGTTSVATFSTTNGAGFIVIAFAKVNLTDPITIEEIKNNNIQLEEGTTATTYEPYKGDKTEILSATPWKQWDSTDKNGVKTVGGGDGVLNGTENWQPFSTQTNTITFVSSRPQNSKQKSIVISNKFKSDENFVLDSENLYIATDNIVCTILKSKLTTLDVVGFKTWLSQNNVTFVYQLATPTYENSNKTLNLRGYDNLIVNAGAIQPTVNYSYAKNTGERFVSIENTLDGVIDKVDKFGEYEEIILTPLNGFTNLEDYNSNKAIKKGSVVTLKIRVNPTKVPFPYNYNILFHIPKNITPSTALSDFIVATDKGVMSLGVLDNGSIITHDIKTTEQSTYIIGTITYVI